MNYPKAMMDVREATNEDPWGPTGPQMKKICEYTRSLVTNIVTSVMCFFAGDIWRISTMSTRRSSKECWKTIRMHGDVSIRCWERAYKVLLLKQYIPSKKFQTKQLTDKIIVGVISQRSIKIMSLWNRKIKLGIFSVVSC